MSMKGVVFATVRVLLSSYESGVSWTYPTTARTLTVITDFR